MNLRLMETTLSVALAASVFACACNRAPEVAGGPVAGDIAGSQSAASVVAEVGERKITMRELNEHVAPQLRELDEQQFEIRRQGLDQMINQQLVQAAAMKKGQSEEEFLRDEVDGKIAKPSDEAAKKFFEQNSAQLPPGAKFEDFKDRIIPFMTRQAHSDRAKDVFAELRKDTRVVISLTPPPKPRLKVEAKGPSKGPEDAKVTIVEFSDFECPFCSRAKATVDKVTEKFNGKVKLVFRQFPLSFHSHARKAAEASLCANAQGKFWEYHDALFAEQSKLDVPDLKATAASLGLDKAKFDSCLDGEEMGKTIDEDMKAAEAVGVSGTPAFFINGINLSGAQPAEEFERVINQELAGK